LATRILFSSNLRPTRQALLHPPSRKRNILLVRLLRERESVISQLAAVERELADARDEQLLGDAGSGGSEDAAAAALAELLDSHHE
jgi:hypothetical protein